MFSLCIFNDGGGNNVSGALIYLRKHLPDFKESWWTALAPYVTGSGGLYCSDVQLNACEEILDATVVFVDGVAGEYREVEDGWRDYNVRETGEEISDREAQWKREDDAEELELSKEQE